MLRKVVATKYADLRDPRGRVREAVRCELECGHHVVVYYSARRAYTRARCTWCERERAEGVRYVWNTARRGRWSDGLPEYVPETEVR